MVEEEIVKRYPEQEMRTPVHLCIGQEAVPVGISENLEEGDKILSGHRSHGHYLACGGDLPRMIAEIYGRSTGCSKGKGGSQHLVDTSVGFLGSAPILASTISIGTGVALALKYMNKSKVCIVYFGDAATEEGTFHESLSFASLHKLPIVFICENNLYSTHSALSVRQPSRPIEDLGYSHAVASETIDGNDVISISESGRRAISRARSGDGPSFLVFNTYRWLGHVGPNSDINLGYRNSEELESWMRKDPIEKIRRILLLTNLNWAETEKDIENEHAQAINEAFEFARNSPTPDIEELLLGVFPWKTGEHGS